jgi:RHS repeat-associated protein
VTRYESSKETRQYANAPRDRGVGLDLMGARFYAPDLGVWTIADPVLLNAPEKVAGEQFGTANPYAYANLNPVIAVDNDGNFWNILIGAGIGILVGGGVEAARQYMATGRVESWGRVVAAAAGGAVSGAIIGANPAIGLASVMAYGATAGGAAGVTERLINSGGKSAGTVQDVLVDQAVGALTAGALKGGSVVVRRLVAARVPVAAAAGARVAEKEADAVARPGVSGAMDSFDMHWYHWSGGGQATFKAKGAGVIVDGIKRGGAPPGSAGAMLGDSLRAAGLSRPSSLIAPNVIQKTPGSNDLLEGVLRSAAAELGGTVTAASRGVDAGNHWVQVEIAHW